jgi:hypothetical protein
MVALWLMGVTSDTSLATRLFNSFFDRGPVGLLFQSTFTFDSDEGNDSSGMWLDSDEGLVALFPGSPQARVAIKTPSLAVI